MQKKHFLFLSLLIGLVLANAQGLSVEELQLSLTQEGKMHNMVQSINGDLILVGETNAPRARSPRQAFMLMVKPETGEVTDYQFGETDKRNVFHTIVQIEDGGFYVAGESSNPEDRSKYAWLLRLDEEGNELKDEVHTQETGVYKHIAYLGNQNFVLTKEMEQQSGKRLELVFFQNGRRAFSRTYGDGNYDNVIGMFATQDNHVVLCGNTRKNNKTKSKSGGVWILKIDKNGKQINTNTIHNEEGDIQGNTLSTAYDYTAVLSGQIATKKGQEFWAMEFDEQLNIKWQKIINDELDESGLGMVKNVYNQYLVLDAYLSNSSKRMRLLNRINTPTIPTEFPEDINLAVKKLMYAYQNYYIVAGNVGRAEKSVRLLKITNKNGFSPKSAHAFEGTNTLELIDFRIDSGAENILSPGERGSLDVTIRNNTDFAVRNINIKVVPLTDATDIRYFDVVREFYIGKNQSQTITIPFNAKDKLRAGEYEFRLDFSDEKKKDIGSIRLPPMKAQKSPTGRGVVFIDFPMGESSDRVGGESYELKVKISSNLPLRQDDIKGYIHLVDLDDSKKGKNIITIKDQDQEYQYEVTFNFQLEPNTNNDLRIVIKSGNQTLKEKIFTVIQENRKPNLHVLAIAPKYGNLKYNDDDVNDFIKVMEAQANRGVFNQVYSYQYTGRDSTTKTMLEIAFEEFCEKFTEGKGEKKILAKDIVVIFYSGHGINPKNELRLVPSDYNSERKLITTVNYEQAVLKRLEKIDCHKIMFIDACHSGASGSKSLDFKDKNLSDLLIRLHQSPKGLITLTSCKGNELSYENDLLQNSFFASAIIQAFAGKEIILQDGTSLHPDENGLDIDYIYQFAKQRMEEIIPSGEMQHPQLIKGSGDLDTSFPLFQIIEN